MQKICEMHYPKLFDNNNDINLTLLQIGLMPIGTGLPSPATLLFNRPIRALLPQMNREPININADEEHYKALKHIKVNT